MSALRSFKIGSSFGCLLLMALEARGDSGGVDKSCVDQVLSQGIPAWKKAASVEDDVQVVCHARVEERSVSKGKVSDVTKDEYWRISWNASKARRIVEHHYIDDGLQGFFVANPEYKFLVGKDASTKRDGYLLTSCYKYVNPTDVLKFDPAEQTAYNDLLGSGYRILGVSLAELMDRADFKLTGAHYTGTRDHRLVRIEWECTRGSELWRSPGTIYWAELDPSESWLMARGGIRRPKKSMELLQETVYQPVEWTGTPFPLRFTQSARLQDWTRQTTCTFETPQRCNRLDEEYTLPFYGFPETAVRPSTPRSWVKLVMIGVGILGVIISFVLHQFSRKKPKV